MPPKVKIPKDLPGQPSLFRDKVRKPISITMRLEHRESCARNAQRLGLTRADFLEWLVHHHGDTTELDPNDPHVKQWLEETQKNPRKPANKNK